jgi:hypothetical protein
LLYGGVILANSDFSIFYEQYRQKQNWHHNFMADRYSNLISGALQEVQPLWGERNRLYIELRKKHNNDFGYDDEFEFVHHNRNRKNYEIFGGKPPYSSYLKTNRRILYHIITKGKLTLL